MISDESEQQTTHLIYFTEGMMRCNHECHRHCLLHAREESGSDIQSVTLTI